MFYREADGVLTPAPTLFEALKLPACPHLIISLVGAGGKTSAMYRLADELAAEGKRVAVTTSTHIFWPDDRRVAATDRAEEAIPELRAGEVLVIGRAVEAEGMNVRENGQGKPCSLPAADSKKMRGLPLPELKKLSSAADVLLIEADGAKRLPLKVPKDGEPVILPETDVVIACAGLDSLGQTFEAACFRFETEGGWLRGGAVTSADTISPGDIAEILTDQRGAGKSVEAREYRILLNKADDEARRNQALAVIEKIHGIDGICCAVSSFKR